MVAPTILWRYTLREILVHTLLGLAVFSLVLVAANTLRILEQLLSVGIGLAELSWVVALILPSYMAYAIPTSLLFGVLLTFGRLSADGEIVAIRASGISVLQLLPPVLLLGAFASLITGYLLFDLEPRSRMAMKQLVRKMASSIRLVEPGRFRNLGSHVLYVHEQGNADCPLRGLLIEDFSNENRRTYISAACGKVESSEDSDWITLQLFDGTIHFSDASLERYRRIRFGTMEATLDMSAYLDLRRKAQDFTFSELLALNASFEGGETPEFRGGTREVVQTQIHRRFAFPLAGVALALVSVPLGIRPARTGRSAGALTAVALMGAYWCLFTAGEIAGEKGYLPAWLGVWTPNLLVVTLGALLLRGTVRGDS